MKCSSPSSERNKTVIGDVFEEHMQCKSVFEVASGTGQHVAYLAHRFKDVTFQPSEIEIDKLDSIREWSLGLKNVLDPLMLDTQNSEDENRVGTFEGLMCFNMIHISPYESCEGMSKLARRILVPGGRVLLYGPFIRDGVETSNSNLEFDGWLKSNDSRFGIRHLNRVKDTFLDAGLIFMEVIEMPANNCTVLFENSQT